MPERPPDPGGDERRTPFLSVRDIGVVVLLVVAVGGVAVWKLDDAKRCEPRGRVHPGIACGGDTRVTSAHYAALEREVRTYLEGRRAAGKLRHAAVYARALRNGPELEIDEYETFAPASLLKLPIVLSFFRFRAEDPTLFEHELPYDPAAVTHYTIPQQVEAPRTKLRLGERYSIETLLENAIVHSDNLSYYLLLEHGNYAVPNGRTRFQRTFQELGIVDPRSFEDETFSPRGYGRVFELLYNASFLGVTDSNLVLSWLERAAYHDGLVAGVPKGVAVGHKFGERVLADGSRQLHDCGIVFLEHDPYSLCVMTEGETFEDLRTVIREVSRMVYEASAVGSSAKIARASQG